MIVVDASAAIAALLHRGEARREMADQQLHAPHMIDPEVVSVLRRHVASGRLDEVTGRRLVGVWQRVAVTRYPAVALLSRMWELWANVSAYDAAYVALAETLGCRLLTADARLARAPALPCAVTVVPG